MRRALDVVGHDTHLVDDLADSNSNCIALHAHLEVGFGLKVGPFLLHHGCITTMDFGVDTCGYVDAAG